MSVLLWFKRISQYHEMASTFTGHVILQLREILTQVDHTLITFELTVSLAGYWPTLYIAQYSI